MQSIVVVFLLILVSRSSVNCSNVTIGGRIVGGSEVFIRTLPFVVSVRYDGIHICGGSIISATKILTAAHCTNGYASPLFSITAGTSDRTKGILYQVDHVKQHPDYNEEYLLNDISILCLTTPIKISITKQPVKVALRRPADNTLVMVSGWGTTTENGKGTNMLRAVVLHVINQEDCRASYRKSKLGDSMLRSTTLCAAAKNKDSCQGDSGGPLVNLAKQLVGISSWGIGCAQEDFPGIYTSVAEYKDFIESE